MTDDKRTCGDCEHCKDALGIDGKDTYCTAPRPAFEGMNYRVHLSRFDWAETCECFARKAKP